MKAYLQPKDIYLHVIYIWPEDLYIQVRYTELSQTVILFRCLSAIFASNLSLLPPNPTTFIKKSIPQNFQCLNFLFFLAHRIRLRKDFSEMFEKMLQRNYFFIFTHKQQ